MTDLYMALYLHEDAYCLFGGGGSLQWCSEVIKTFLEE